MLLLVVLGVVDVVHPLAMCVTYGPSFCHFYRAIYFIEAVIPPLYYGGLLYKSSGVHHFQNVAFQIYFLLTKETTREYLWQDFI
jgi:hypothetical protein